MVPGVRPGMTRSVRSLRPHRRFALVLAASLVLGACGVEATKGDGPPVWAPQGSPPPVTLNSPGDGGTITITVGDRVQLPPNPDGTGGIRFAPDEHAERLDLLVPYGDLSTFLAVAPGEVHLQDTIYDSEGSCASPRPVAEFTLVIEEGPRPDIGEPVEVTLADDGAVVTLVPGQALTHDPDLTLLIDAGHREDRTDDDRTEDGDGVLSTDGWALRPGTVEVRLSTLPPPRNGDRSATFTIVVSDPDDTSTANTGPDEDAAASTPSAEPDTTDAPDTTTDQADEAPSTLRSGTGSGASRNALGAPGSRSCGG